MTDSDTPYTTFGLAFVTSVTTAQFYLYFDITDNEPASGAAVTVTATLGGAAVRDGSFVITAPWSGGGADYFGFANSDPFDNITVTMTNASLMFIDNLQVGAPASVPEPASALLVMAGLGGIAVRRRRV